MNWNKNGIYNISQSIPQCQYKEISLSSVDGDEYDDNIDDNDYCHVMEYNESLVKCGCNKFGSYTTNVIDIEKDDDANKVQINYPITMIIFISCLVALFLCLCSLKCSKFDDEPLISKEVYMSDDNKFNTWLLTKKGWIYWILKYEPSKFYQLFIHLMKNDDFILQFCFRSKGSNYFTIQRIINLLWLISFLIVVIVTITDYDGIHQEIWLLLILSCFIGVGMYNLHKRCFELVNPRKLEHDVALLLSNPLSPLSFSEQCSYSNIKNT